MKKKYKFVIEDAQGKKYIADSEFVKQNMLGICTIKGDLSLFKEHTKNDISALKHILHRTIVDYFKKEILEMLKQRRKNKRKQFRLHWITYALSLRRSFYLEKLEAFDEMLKEELIVKGTSHGWYKVGWIDYENR